MCKIQKKRKKKFQEEAGRVKLETNPKPKKVMSKRPPKGLSQGNLTRQSHNLTFSFPWETYRELLETEVVGKTLE